MGVATSALPKTQDEALARGFSAEQIEAHLRVQALVGADAARDPVLEWRVVEAGPHEVFISGGIVEKTLTIEEKVYNPMAEWDDDEDAYFMSTRHYKWAERELVFRPAFGKHAGQTILLRYSLNEDAKYGGDARRGVLESSVMGHVQGVGVFCAGETEDGKLVQSICELLLAGALDGSTGGSLGGPAEWRAAQRCWEAWPTTMQVTLHPPVMEITTVTTKIPADGLPVRSAVALTLPALYHELIERGTDEQTAVEAVERFAAAGETIRVFRPDATPMLNLYEQRSMREETVPMNWDAVRKQWAAVPAAEGAGQTGALAQAAAEGGSKAEAELEDAANAVIAAFTIVWLASHPADVVHDVINGEISTGALAAVNPGSEPQEARGLAHRFGSPPGSSAWGVGDDLIRELITEDDSFRTPGPGEGGAPQSLPVDQIAALNQQQGSSAPCVIMPPAMVLRRASAGVSVGGLVHVFRATGEPWVQFCLNETCDGNMCGGSHFSVWADGGWPASVVKLYVLCLLSNAGHLQSPGRLPPPARFCRAGRGADLTFTSLKDELTALTGGGGVPRRYQELCLSYKSR